MTTSCGQIFGGGEQSGSDLDIEITGNERPVPASGDDDAAEDETDELQTGEDDEVADEGDENTEDADSSDETVTAETPEILGETSGESGFSYGFESRLQELRDADGNWRAWSITWDTGGKKPVPVDGDDKRWCDALAILQEAGYRYALTFLAYPGIDDVLQSLDGLRNAVENVASFKSRVPNEVAEFSRQFSSMVDDLQTSDSIEEIRQTTLGAEPLARPFFVELIEQVEDDCTGVPVPT